MANTDTVVLLFNTVSVIDMPCGKLDGFKISSVSKNYFNETQLSYSGSSK